MRSLDPDNGAEATYIADYVATVIISTAGAVVAQDYPDGAEFMHVSTDTALWINFHSTGVIIPTASLAATTASSGLSIVHNTGHEHIYRTHGSTGYSITAASSARATIEFWGA